MKFETLLIGASALALATPVSAQDAPRVQPVQVDPLRPDWENPAVFARGRLPAHATGFPFESRAAALAGDQAKSARFLNLDGTWKFRCRRLRMRRPPGSSSRITMSRAGSISRCRPTGRRKGSIRRATTTSPIRFPPTAH